MTKNISFNKNYKILKEIAEKLRNQNELDIDALVPMVESATEAYKHCKTRIEAVKKALEKHMPDDFEEEN